MMPHGHRPLMLDYTRRNNDIRLSYREALVNPVIVKAFTVQTRGTLSSSLSSSRSRFFFGQEEW